MWSNPRAPFELSNARPALAPANGKNIIVNIAVNVEYWPFDRPMPRGVLPPPHGKPSVPPDLPNFGWVEYGLRAGMPRLMGMLAKRGLRASALMNAAVVDVYPPLADAILEAQWEFVGHGWHQESLKDADDEEGVIVRSLERMRSFSGQSVRAWLGPGGAETMHTPDLLKKHGVTFIHDWSLDDLPCWMRTVHGPAVAMPYTFELNDVPIHVIQHLPSDTLLRRTEATLEVFAREARPRVMTIALHPHLIGVAHVAFHFEKLLDLLVAHDDTTFMTSSEIGDWFIAADGTRGAALEQHSDGPPAA